jgi:hydrogenase expression/formation protein HypE
MTDDAILLAHGSGGKLSHDLVERLFARHFANPTLLQLDDSAILDFRFPDSLIPNPQFPNFPISRLAFSTDSYVISPLFFPGGDIGKLAVCGTVNDVSMSGARPLWLSAGFIIEEGLSMAELERIVASMAATAQQAGVQIVTGDTKVVDRGSADKLFINTAGVGVVPAGIEIAGDRARPGDVVLLSGTIGDHGMTILTQREGLQFDSPLASDCAPLNGLVADLLAALPPHPRPISPPLGEGAGEGELVAGVLLSPSPSPSPEGGEKAPSPLGGEGWGEGGVVHCLRDPTRGGLATTLNELAGQSGVGIEIEETAIPVREAVRGACELLGLDPLYVANEGKLVALVTPEAGQAALAALRAHEYGCEAAIIGRVTADHPGRVVLRTALGARRVVDMLIGEQLPRIC